MKEYKIIRYGDGIPHDDLEDILNELGENDWELVSNNFLTFIFMRDKLDVDVTGHVY